MKKLTILLLALLLVGTVGAQDDDDLQQKAIDLLASQDDVAAFLESYPDWQGEAWNEDGSIWGVDLYSEVADEWLGYGRVNVETGEVLEYFVPKPLPPAQFAEMQPRIEQYVLADPEVLALLGDPLLWNIWIDFNRWEQMWEFAAHRGLDGWIVRVYVEDDYVHIDDIIDANELEAAEAQAQARHEAIFLASEADGLWEALEGIDEWFTYAEQQRGPLWSVTFATEDNELFFAVVNIETGVIIETKLPS